MSKVSIIITTHNRVNLLGRAIESAKTAGDNVEVIVVDDASTDKTSDFCSKLDGINYIRLERNQKTAGARNIGIVASKSPYLCFLDDDDWRLPNSLDSQVKILEQDENCGLVYGQIYFCNQQGEMLEDAPSPAVCPQGDVFIQLLKSIFIPITTVVVRKECLYKVGLFDTHPKMVGIEDYDLFLRIAELFTIKAIEEPVSVYRKPEQNSGQWSSNTIKQLSFIADAYKTKWFNLPRVQKEFGSRTEASKRLFISEISERMMYDAVHNSKDFFDKLYKIFKAVECYPPAVTRLNFYKTLVKSL